MCETVQGINAVWLLEASGAFVPPPRNQIGLPTKVRQPAPKRGPNEQLRTANSNKAIEYCLQHRLSAWTKSPIEATVSYDRHSKSREISMGLEEAKSYTEQRRESS